MFSENIGTASLMGRRKNNEDRFIISRLADDLLCFAVFDGHGGSTAVDFVHKNLEHHLNFWLARTKDLKVVLKRSFIDVNNLLARHITFYDLSKYEHCKWRHRCM